MIVRTLVAALFAVALGTQSAQAAPLLDPIDVDEEIEDVRGFEANLARYVHAFRRYFHLR